VRFLAKIFSISVATLSTIALCATLFAADCVAVTTTATLWSSVGNGTQIPPPSSIQFFQGDSLHLQGVIDYTTPAGVTLPDPTGSLSFYDGAQLLATVPISQGMTYCGTFPCTRWQAFVDTSTLTVGSHALTVVYSGDSLYGTSTSTVVTALVVARPVVPVTQFSGTTATGSGQATLSVAGGGPTCGIVRGQYVPTSGEATSPPPGLIFPHGLVAFVVGGCSPGSTVSFTLLLPDAAPANLTYWKFGPTPSDNNPHWYSIPITVNGNAVMFSIIDGGIGDDDLTANGTLIDAGGPAVLLAGSVAAIPALSRKVLAVAVVSLMLLGGVALRRARTRGPGLHR